MMSVRLRHQDAARLSQLADELATNPSEAIRRLLRAAVPVPLERYTAGPDDPAERDTLPPSAPDGEVASDGTSERDTLPPADPRQLDLYDCASVPVGKKHG